MPLEIIFICNTVHSESITEFISACVIDQDTAQVISFNPGADLAHLLALAGLFPSVSQAKKNGFSRSLKNGWDWFDFGKKKISVLILNSTPWNHLPILEQNKLFESEDYEE